MKRMPTAFHAAPLAGLALRCQPDIRLVTLCREGHERAFEEIVRRYRQSLVRFAAAIVPAHRAEDVVQEALTRAHSSLVATDAEIRLKPWLYTIVRNRAFNDLRDEPAHQHLAEDLDGVPQPPEVAAQRSELAAVLAGVKSLPVGQREALLQRELEGRSHEEIAVAIGVTPGAVRGLIFRARTALREAAGALVPLPVLRALINAGPLTTEATGAGVGGAAAGLTAGGGGGIAVKAGATLLDRRARGRIRDRPARPRRQAGRDRRHGGATRRFGAGAARAAARTVGQSRSGTSTTASDSGRGPGAGAGSDDGSGPPPIGSGRSSDGSGRSGGERGTSTVTGSRRAARARMATGGSRREATVHRRGDGDHQDGGQVGDEHEGGGTGGGHEGTGETGGDGEGSGGDGSGEDGSTGDDEGSGQERGLRLARRHRAAAAARTPKPRRSTS